MSPISKTTYPGTGEWKKMRINQRFLRSLQREAQGYEVNNHFAYVVYALYHSSKRNKIRATWRRPLEEDPWLQKNVRNNLCAAAHRGLLVRVGLGRYRFPESRLE